MGFFFSSTSVSTSFYIRFSVLLSCFLFPLFPVGASRVRQGLSLCDFFMGKCTKASRGSKSMRIFSEVDA
jgi:hypothetical protein